MEQQARTSDGKLETTVVDSRDCVKRAESRQLLR